MGWVLTPSKLQLPPDKLCLGVLIFQPKALPLWKKPWLSFELDLKKIFLRFSFRTASQLGSDPALWVLTGHKCPSQQLSTTTNSDLESNTSLAQVLSHHVPLGGLKSWPLSSLGFFYFWLTVSHVEIPANHGQFPHINFFWIEETRK